MASATESLWLRYLPGLVAAIGGALIVGAAPARRRSMFAGLATLLGLLCAQAEHWVAGFPKSGINYLVFAIGITLVALALGKHGCLILGIVGIFGYADVNTRYGAPYLLDYVMPGLYAAMIASSRRELGWFRPGFLRVGAPEAICLVLVEVLAAFRTAELGKWGWLAGKTPFRI